MDFLSKLGIGEPEEVRNNKKLIKQTEQKQAQLLKSIDIDIDRLNSEISTIFAEIGQKVAEECLNNGKDTIEKSLIMNFIEDIQAKKELIKNHEIKKEDIKKRYGEELDILRKLIPEENKANVNSEGNESVAESKEVCPECGAVRGKEALFCISCGHKFE